MSFKKVLRRFDCFSHLFKAVAYSAIGLSERLKRGGFIKQTSQNRWETVFKFTAAAKITLEKWHGKQLIGQLLDGLYTTAFSSSSSKTADTRREPPLSGPFFSSSLPSFSSFPPFPFLRLFFLLLLPAVSANFSSLQKAGGGGGSQEGGKRRPKLHGRERGGREGWS